MRLSVGRVQPGGTFTLSLQLYRRVKDAVVRAAPEFADARRSRETRASNLIAALRSECPDLILSLQRAAQADSVLDLRIDEPRFYDVPWESALSELLGTPMRFRRLVPGVKSRVPVVPPYKVLWAGAADPAAAFAPRPPLELKHYRSLVSEGTTPATLEHFVAEGPFQVVHIAHTGAVKRRGPGALELGGSPDLVSPADLLALTEGHPPDLLVLEGGPGTMNGLVNFAHNYARQSGATVLAVESLGAEASRELSRGIYLGIAHDQPLDYAVYELPHREEPPVLILPPDGEEALRLEHPEHTIISGYRNLELQTKEGLGRLDRISRSARKFGANPTYIATIDRQKEALRSARRRLRRNSLEFSYSREADGLEPMGAAAEVASEVSEIVRRSAAVTERVVNIWFAEGRMSVKPSEDLECRRTYSLVVQIGVPSTKSNNRTPRTLPEKELERFMTSEGLSLRAVLHSRHFYVEASERVLHLPPWPSESEPLDFEVVAPPEPGLAELLLLIYYKQNLLQAIRIWAGIFEPKTETKSLGNWSKTEFALDKFSEAVEELPQKDAQLYVSVGTNPTHTMSVMETAVKHTFELSDGKLTKALGNSRERLLQLAVDFYDTRKGGQSSLSQLLSDLQILAQTGVAFFEALVPERKHRTTFADSIAGHRTLQVAHSKSLDQLFPWALVYDHPLLVTEPKLCPDAEKVFKNQRATVADWKALECMTQGCRSRGERSTICPSGFWGFRHAIELPMSLTSFGDGEPGGGMKRSIQAGEEVHLCMAAWRDFKRLKGHHKGLEAIPRLRLDEPKYEKSTLSGRLEQRDVHILYFFCHGDENPAVSPPTVLRLGWEGNPSFVYATDMSYFVEWQDVGPLVFINGCHTLNATADDLVSFNKSLSEGGAAAVIGTEIKVPEALAAPAAESLLTMLANRVALGASLRDFRLELLSNRNILGLAYTAYGYSGLTIT